MDLFQRKAVYNHIKTTNLPAKLYSDVAKEDLGWKHLIREYGYT